MRNALKKPANSAAYTLGQFDRKANKVRHTNVRMVSICSTHSFPRSRSTRSITVRALALNTVPLGGWLLAFIIVFPGSLGRLGRLRFF